MNYYKDSAKSMQDWFNTQYFGKLDIAAELAKKNNLKKAVSIAKNYITQAIKTGKNLHIGKGSGPLNHSVYL